MYSLMSMVLPQLIFRRTEKRFIRLKRGAADGVVPSVAWGCQVGEGKRQGERRPCDPQGLVSALHNSFSLCYKTFYGLFTEAFSAVAYTSVAETLKALSVIPLKLY